MDQVKHFDQHMASPICSVVNQAISRGDIVGAAVGYAHREGNGCCQAFGLADQSSHELVRPDTLFFIASMTKMLTAVAALQLVELGKLSLDQPLANLVPALNCAQVLDGFDGTGQPILRQPDRPITLLHLLTQTAGFSYEHWDARIARYLAHYDVPSILSYQLAALDVPLVSHPGDEWHYGLNMEFVGRAIEAASGKSLDQYFQDHITGPLGMRNTGYRPHDLESGTIAAIHRRDEAGILQSAPFSLPADGQFCPGGVGLYSTVADYLTLCRALLNDGILHGCRVLAAESITALSVRHPNTGVRPMRTESPFWSEDVDLFPQEDAFWGLGMMVNSRKSPATGRHAGTLSWGGACNSYFWIDHDAGLTGVYMTQSIPFCDRRVLGAYREFERAVYASEDLQIGRA